MQRKFKDYAVDPELNRLLAMLTIGGDPDDDDDDDDDGDDPKGPPSNN